MVARTVMVGEASWDQLCMLARQLTNAPEVTLKEFRSSVAYMATHSMGARSYDGDPEEAHQVPDPHFNGGCWEGYTEDQVSYLEWGSATSGAYLTAEKNGRNWVLKYEGPEKEQESWPGESSYMLLFADAVAAPKVMRFRSKRSVHDRLLAEAVTTGLTARWIEWGSKIGIRIGTA